MTSSPSPTAVTNRGPVPADHGDRRGPTSPVPPAAPVVVSRAIRPDDDVRLCALLPRLSPETRYRRFFSPVHRVDRRTLRYLVEVDHHDREAVVALVDDEIIAVARYDRSHLDPASAEIAVVVEDAWQRRGVGRYLVQRLGVLAAERGIERFTAQVLPSNDAPVRLARAVAPLVEVGFADGETQLVIPVVPAARESRRTARGSGASEPGARPRPTTRVA